MTKYSRAATEAEGRMGPGAKADAAAAMASTIDARSIEERVGLGVRISLMGFPVFFPPKTHMVGPVPSPFSDL